MVRKGIGLRSHRHLEAALLYIIAPSVEIEETGIATVAEALGKLGARRQ
jgi:hypothetical protein